MPGFRRARPSKRKACQHRWSITPTNIKSNPAWEFTEIYSDSGISGKSKEQRAEFMRMVKEDAEDRKFDLIITKSIFRFARNKIDCLETVRKLKSLGIGIVFEKSK